VCSYNYICLPISGAKLDQFQGGMRFFFLLIIMMVGCQACDYELQI